MCRNENFEVLDKNVAYIFRLLKVFLFYFTFFCLFFFSFSYLLAAAVDLLLGLLPVEEFQRKHNRDRKFLAGSSQVHLREVFHSNF